MKDILLGFDFGTNGVKALAYKIECHQIVASAYRSYSVIIPNPGWAEQRPDEWWKAFSGCIKDMLKSGKIDGTDVKALSVSSHTPTLTPLDENGIPLMNGLIWADGRAEQESREITEKYGSMLQEVNPAYVRPYHMISKLLWMKRQ